MQNTFISMVTLKYIQNRLKSSFVPPLNFYYEISDLKKNTYILNCFLYDSGMQKTLQVYERVSTWPWFTGGYVAKQEVGRENETMRIPCGSLLQNTTSGL